ncbi:MAG: radical SAM protein [Acidimicrobiales bacterium]|nr:radical SAM protein [Acidimicrobiales bacterium]
MAEQAVELSARGPVAPSDRRPACRAPSSSLYLDPAGRVTACCANTWYPLGDLRHQTLSEVWRGGPARQLRERVSAGRLDLGCELCAAEVGRGAADSAELRRFEPLPVPDRGDADPPWPVQLELALSNACNLQCVMCNGELSSAIRAHREGRAPLPPVYDDAFFADLDAFLPHLRRVFLLGGEPFLGAEPLRVLDRLVERGLAPEVYVTTNGTQWSPRVARILSSLPVDVSVSVDGFRAETVEAIRVGVRHEDLVRNIERYREACQDNGGGFSLTFCLQRGNWHELGEVLAWGDRLGALVGVSTLTNPPHLGLHGLDVGALDAMARRLHEEDATRRRALDRNRPAWDAALARVDGLLAERARRSAPGGPGAAAEQRAAAWARAEEGGPGVEGVHRVRADASQLVRSVETAGGDALAHGLASLVGRPTRSVIDAVRGALGPVRATELVVHADGVEERRLRFAAAEVRAWLVPGPDEGHEWLLVARPVAAAADPAQGLPH